MFQKKKKKWLPNTHFLEILVLQMFILPFNIFYSYTTFMSPYLSFIYRCN